jgi:hypothetical protein
MGRLRRLSAVAIAAGVVLLGAACQGDDASSGAAFDSGGADLGGSDPAPEVDACALGAEMIGDVLPSAEAEPSTAETDGYDCLWSGGKHGSFEVSLAVWDAASYSALEEQEAQFETRTTTFRPLRGLGVEGWYSDNVSGDEVSWRTDDFTVSLGGIVSDGLSERELIRIARAIDADLASM